ncbi:MAG: hypothetical protein ACREAY_05105 [Nitrososphaera sp.]|uniref:hypothetical protein n=1 Tax=Nitrososphaera sp. TaxID=1971748 RepID=UPI003D6DB7DC
MLEQFLLQAELAIAALVVIVGLLMMWIIVSVPVWIAAKIVTLGRAKFTRAMLVTAVGPFIYALVFFLSNAALTATLGQQFLIAAISFILAFIAWIGVFKVGFRTGWIRALGIAFVATIVFVIIGAIVTAGLQAVAPGTPAITPFPSF